MLDFFNPAPAAAATDILNEWLNLDGAADNESDGSPTSAALGLTPQATPAPPYPSSPQPLESGKMSLENFESLDNNSLSTLFNMNFESSMPPAGISHNPSDIFADLAASNASQTTNSTFSSAFDATLGGLARSGTESQAQNELADIVRQFLTQTPATAPAPTSNDQSVADAFNLLDWMPTNGVPTTASVSSPASVSMKRKASEIESEDGTNKSARSSTPAKRPYRRQSKNAPTAARIAAATVTGTPLVHDDAEVTKKEDEEDAPVRLTSTGKPSTARPKAVVPEKYMKNGEAQTITGMATDQILAYPNWEALMQDVDEIHRPGAEVFGRMISENRDKAKWAAKKSRDERKQKVEQLEGQVDELQTKIEGMRNVMLGLVRKGLINISEIEKYI